MRPPARTLRTLTALVGALVLVAGCSSSSGSSASATGDSWLGTYGLEGLSARAAIEKLDATALADRSTALTASVRPAELQLSDDQGHETSLALPDDEFYLSFAPYVDDTHECFFHSLTTCKGEMGDQDVKVTVTDKADGDVLLDETVRTHDNGFAGIWLPRDIEATLTIEHADGMATLPIGTGDDDPTCVTTAKLT